MGTRVPVILSLGTSSQHNAAARRTQKVFDSSRGSPYSALVDSAVLGNLTMVADNAISLYGLLS